MSSQSSSRSSSSSLSTDGSSSDTSSSSSSRQEERSQRKGESEGRQSSERSSSGTPSLITPTVSSAITLAHERTQGRAPAHGVPPFHAAVGHVMDLLQTTLASQGELPKVASVKAEDPPSAQHGELQRIPSLQTLLKLQDGDLDDLLGRPRRPSDEDPGGEESEGIFSSPHKKRSSGPAHSRDRHGRVRHNWNAVRIETLSLGMRHLDQRNDKTKPESEVEKSWGDIAGKLAFVLTRLDQVVPMSASRLLNEALDPFGTERRLSANTKQKMEGMAQSRIDVRGMLQALSRSDPMKSLKDSANVAIVTRLEEYAACEKDIAVRERHVDTPEMVQLGLQRWSVQQGFCLSNIAERRELARALCVARRNNTRRGRRRMNNATARRKAMEDMMSSKVSHMTTQMSPTQSKAQDEDGNPRAKDKEVLRDLTTERGVLLEIKREMTKLKRKRRVLEDQWAEQPRILLSRLENQSRSLRLKVEAKMDELEVGRQRLADANRRWQSNRTLTEPTLVDLEIQAYDIRRELAVSVLRWVRKDRSEALNEWRTQMAKYHQDKTRMAGNFAEAVRHWREDANFALPGSSGINPWKASLAFTPQAVQEGDPEEDEQLSHRRVQIHQGLTLAGITRNQLINQERMLDNRKRPLGNCWELLRRQYMTYRSILEAQLQHWLRGDFVGPCLRRVRDLTGAFQTSLAEVVKELEAVRSGAREDSKVPDIEAKRREGDRRQRTGKDRSELKMEEALQNILLHLEKEMSLLANITAPRGELSELLRTQQQLSNIASARPFSLDDLSGHAPPQGTPNGRKLSKSAAAGAEEPPQVTYLVVQEGLEAPVRAARQLARLLCISWSTYLGKWEGLIRRYQEARSAYLEFQQKCAETARQKLLRDLRERPYLFEDLLKKSNAKWRQVEDNFRRTHTQPVYDRYKELSNAVADLSTELLQLKKQTHAMQQDPSLSFAASLQEETNEELLGRYQQELDAETQRSQELDRQIAVQKELERVILEQQLKPMLTTVAQATRLLQDLGGPEAKEARSSLVVERVVQAEQLVEVLSLADRALRGRGYQAGLAPRKLLQFVETLLWPNASWKDPEEVARKQAARKSRKVSIMSVASSRSNRSQRAKKEKEVTVPISALRRKSEQHVERPKGTGLSDVPSIQLPEPGQETWQAPSIQLPEPSQEIEDVPSIPLPGPDQGADLTISDLPSMPLTGPDQVADPPPELSSVNELHSRQGRRTSTIASEFDTDSVASEPLDPDRSTGPPLLPAPALEPPAQELSRPLLPSPGSSSPSTSPSPTLNQAAAAGVVQPLQPAEDDADAVPEEPSPPEPRDLPGSDHGQEAPELPEHGDEASVPADEPPDELLPLDPLQDEGLAGGDHAALPEAEAAEAASPSPVDEAASTAILDDDTGKLNEVQQEQTPPISEAQEETSKEEVSMLEGPEAAQQSPETESFLEEASGVEMPLPGEPAPCEQEPEIQDIRPEMLPPADEQTEPAVSESRPASQPSKDRKVRIAEAPQEVEERDVELQEDEAIEEDPGSTEVQMEDPPKPAGTLFQVFSHSEPPGVGFLAPTPQGPPKMRWKDWLKGEEAAQSYSNPVLQRMQEVRAALLGSSGVSRPAKASSSLRSWVKQRSRLAGVAAAELPKGGLSVGDLRPNAFKALDRRPTRRSPPWMAADRSRQGSPVSPVPAVDELSIKPQPQRLLITSDSMSRLGRLQTPTQITLDFDDEFLRPPSPPLGPCRTLGGGFKAPVQSRPGSRQEGMLPSLRDRAEQQLTAGREGLAVRSSRDKRECQPTSSPGPMAELWGHARPKGQWKVLLSTGRDSPGKAREIHTGELRELMSARGFQVKTPDVAEASPVRAKVPSPTRPPLETQDLAEFLHFVKRGPGSPDKPKPKRRRRPISNAKGTRLRAARMSPDPDVSLGPFLATVRQSAPTPV